MEPTSFDQLMGRAFDGAAHADDWNALESAVRCEPVLAAALVRGLRVERGLESALAEAGALAERVELPRARALSLRRHAGWIAAAAIALAWTLSAARGAANELQRPSPWADATSADSADADAASADAADSEANGAVAAADERSALARQQADPHLESLGELPLRLVHSRPLESGRFEVLYVRPVLERTVVDGALGLAPDELGQPHIVPARFDSSSDPRSL